MMIVESLTLFQLLKPKEPTLPQPTPPETVKVAPKPKPKKTFYTIKQGDSLSKIGKKTRTPWKNIWAANKTLKHQDKLEPGTKLVIPKGKVKPRKLATTGVRPSQVRNSKPGTLPKKTNYGRLTSANTYEPGSCTWHVKNLAPWIPNGLGDASSWYGNAPSYGLNTSPTARVGAVGWTPGHVVFIKAVRGSEVLVSEMNYDWVAYHQREAWFPASKYQYIY